MSQLSGSNMQPKVQFSQESPTSALHPAAKRTALQDPDLNGNSNTKYGLAHAGLWMPG